MTTATRKKTGKAPWAAVMTAVISVLALVFGALAFAGVASAKDNPNKPDDPGNSTQAPGQDHTPPGQEPGETPGASHDTLTICHFVEGKGETKDGYNIITISEQAWAAHLAHHPDTLDVVYDGVSCPTVTPPTYGANAWVCMNTWATAQKVEVSGQATQEAADLALQAKLAEEYTGSWPAAEGSSCQQPADTYAASTWICMNTWATAQKVEVSGQATQEAADQALQATLSADYAGSWAVAEGTSCPTSSGGGGAVPELATAVAGAIAEAPEAVTVAEQPEAATVAEQPEAATVAEPAKAPKPAKVAVPQPATIPMAVPAGDGSSIPQIPAWVLALLALGTVGLLASTARLATAHRE